MSDIFVSYKREDLSRVALLVNALRAEGMRVWWDQDILPEAPWEATIEHQLAQAKVVIVAWSPAAVASDNVRAEARRARQEGRLLQVFVEACEPPLFFGERQGVNLVGWTGDRAAPSWSRVTAALADHIGPLPVAGEATASQTAGQQVEHGSSRPIQPAPQVDPVALSPAPARPRPRLPRWAWAAGGLAVLFLVAGGAWWLMGRGPATASPSRVAVLPFDVASPEASAFADGLQDEIASVLSSTQVQTVSRTESASIKGPDGASAAQRLGAGLLLEGTVAQTNGIIRVGAHLDDAAARQTIWSESFERPVAESEALQAEVAAKVGRITTQTLSARAEGLTDLATLADYVSADERIRFDWIDGNQAAEPILRSVVRRAPGFAGGHTMLGLSLLLQSLALGNPRAADQRAEGEREVNKGVALDPNAGIGGYNALTLLRPYRDWAGKDALLQKGSALDPTEAAYPFTQGEMLAQEGLLNSAAETERRAVSLNPLWPGAQLDFGTYLMETGHQTEGLATFDRMQRLWPQHAATLEGRFWATAMYGSPDAALALLDDPKTVPTQIMDATAVDLFRRYLMAMKSGAAGDRAAAAKEIRAATDAGAFYPGFATVLLMKLGDTEGAFAAADKYASLPNERLYAFLPPYLFVAPTAPLRRDPRFMGLVAKLGLVQYWQSTGRWPDFCSEPGLPYDCKVEAAKYPSEPGT